MACPDCAFITEAATASDWYTTRDSIPVFEEALAVEFTDLTVTVYPLEAVVAGEVITWENVLANYDAVIANDSISHLSALAARDFMEGAAASDSYAITIPRAQPAEQAIASETPTWNEIEPVAENVVDTAVADDSHTFSAEYAAGEANQAEAQDRIAWSAYYSLNIVEPVDATGTFDYVVNSNHIDAAVAADNITPFTDRTELLIEGAITRDFFSYRINISETFGEALAADSVSFGQKSEKAFDNAIAADFVVYSAAFSTNVMDRAQATAAVSYVPFVSQANYFETGFTYDKHIYYSSDETGNVPHNRGWVFSTLGEAIMPSTVESVDTVLTTPIGILELAKEGVMGIEDRECVVETALLDFGSTAKGTVDSIYMNGVDAPLEVTEHATDGGTYTVSAAPTDTRLARAIMPRGVWTTGVKIEARQKSLRLDSMKLLVAKSKQRY